MKTIFELKELIEKDFGHLDISIDTENHEIIVEEDYNMSENEKNNDDCYDRAKQNGADIIAKFPMLEMSNFYCHRHKYAICVLIPKLSTPIHSLLEKYEKNVSELKVAMNKIKRPFNDSHNVEYSRLQIKMNCYTQFVKELENLKLVYDEQ